MIIRPCRPAARYVLITVNVARAKLAVPKDQASRRRERVMTRTVKARFANGVLTPLETIDLPEGALVLLDIGEIPSTEPAMPTAEAMPSSVSDRADFTGRNEQVNYNRLNDESMVEEYFQAERRFRERNT